MACAHHGPHESQRVQGDGRANYRPSPLSGRFNVIVVESLSLCLQTSFGSEVRLSMVSWIGIILPRAVRKSGFVPCSRSQRSPIHGDGQAGPCTHRQGRPRTPTESNRERSRIPHPRKLAPLVAAAQRGGGGFGRGGFTGKLVESVMADPAFKVEAFRFVDVLPTLRDADEIARHIDEYFNRPGHRCRRG